MSAATALTIDPFAEYAPQPYQLKFHQSKAKIRVVFATRRGGKGRAACFDMVGHIAAFSQKVYPPSLIPHYFIMLIAPTYKDGRQMWMETKELIPKNLIAGGPNEAELTIELINGGYLELRSGYEPGMLKGAGVDYLWMTEAWQIPNQIWYEDVRPMLFSPGRHGKAVIECVPPQSQDHWSEILWQRGQDPNADIESWRYTYKDVPMLEPMWDEIERERETMPEAAWERQYMAVTGIPEDAAFINVDECACSIPEQPVAGKLYYMGVDLGKLMNFTVIQVVRRDTFSVVYTERMGKRDYTLQEDRIVELANLYNKAPIIADATGLGEPIVDALRKRGVIVRPFKFSRTSKTDLIEHLIIAFERREISIPAGSYGPAYRANIRELKNYRRAITPMGMGYERFAARAGEHDDCVDSLALAWQYMPRKSALYNIKPRKSESYLVAVGKRG